MTILQKTTKALALMLLAAPLVSGVYEPEAVSARGVTEANPQERLALANCMYLQGTLLWRGDQFEGCADSQTQLSDFIKRCYMDGHEVTVPSSGHLLCSLD